MSSRSAKPAQSSRRKAPKRTKTNAFLNLLAKVQSQVDPRLSVVVEESEARAHGYGAEVGHMVGAVRSLTERGGKRLRPGLCVVGAIAANAQTDWKPMIEAGVSLELLQAYFLIHDDWMDEDSERRGGPTAHVELSRHFRSTFLGARAAILAGDHAVSLAQAHLASLPTTPKRLQAALATFAEMQLAAVAGQQLDVISKTKTPELTYELKTASYTVLGPLKLGAQLAGARPATLSSLAAYGLPAGVAFQLQDDLIGVFGDPKKTGKPRGADLTAGKNTPLVRHGLRLTSGRDRERIRAVLGNRKAASRRVEGVVSLLDDCGAKAAVQARIAELRAEAEAALDGSGVTSEGQRLLADAIVALTERSA